MPGMLNPINFVTGTLGSGKSYFAMKYVRDYIAEGKVVACNFDLQGDWWKTWMPKKVRRLPESEQWAWQRDARERALRFDVPEDMYDYRLPGEGEDRGLLIIDEGGLRMNSRAWQERKTRDIAKYGTAVKSLELYINMRKLGWSCMILAHSQKQLDNQVQDLGGAIVRLRNFQRVKMPLVGISLSKRPKFLAIHLWPEVGAILKREFYGLDMKVARHYRSMETFDADPTSNGLRRQSDLNDRLGSATVVDSSEWPLDLHQRVEETPPPSVADVTAPPQGRRPADGAASPDTDAGVVTPPRRLAVLVTPPERNTEVTGGRDAG